MSVYETLNYRSVATGRNSLGDTLTHGKQIIRPMIHGHVTGISLFSRGNEGCLKSGDLGKWKSVKRASSEVY